jgi:Protein of unknown function (DUF3352)
VDVTYRDPNEPIGADSPTEAYRVPEAPAIEPVEPASRPAPTSPAVPPSPRRPSRLRWAVAIAVVALVVAVSGVAAVLLTGGAPTAKVLGWVPADSVVYGEVRLDLPGDQRANLAEFLSHFPGFDDQAAIDVKLNETLDQFLTSATNGDQSYTADIAPWFDGELGFTMGTLPDMSTMEDPTAVSVPEAVFLLSIKDAALAQAWFDGVTADASPTTEDYNGTRLTLLASETKGVDATMAYGITDEVAVLGEVGAVKEALDTGGNGGIAGDPEFAAALDSASGDHVGFVYYDMARYWDWAMSLQVEVAAVPLGDIARELLPAWGAMWLRVEGDALRVEVTSAAPERRLGATENRASTLIEHVPATAILYAETHDYGQSLRDMVALYEDFPIPEESLGMLEQAVGLFGGFDGIVGWIGDVGFVVNGTDGGVEGGMVVQSTDATRAENLFLTLRSMLALGGASAGMTVSDEEHGEATIVTVDFGDIGTLMEMGGEDPELAEIFGGADAHVQLSWTVTDDLVVVGLGPDFVKHVLDTESSTSLAQDDQFEALLSRTGRENAGLWFADIAAFRGLFERLATEDPEAFAEYEREVQPFFEPFDALVGSTVLGGESPNRATFLITVK